jgi:hypothetical protein
MTTVYTRASKGSALSWTEGDANITNLNNDKIEAVIDDTTPQLGGNLDVNGNSIVSASNGNIVIAPNGTGAVIIDGNAMPQDSGVADQVLITDGAGQTSWSNVKTVHSLVFNADSVTINKGQVVYLFGANGANPSVKLALNTSDATSAKTYGIANESIAAGATGEIVTQGLIKNVNTAAYAEGDTLYLGSTAGSLTTTKPYGANHLVYVGVVTSVNSTSGRILVRVQNGYELDEIHRVDIDHTQALASADYLTYNGTTGLWQNAPLAIEDDTAPILGGNLDVGGNKIVSTSNGNIAIEPNGTGIVTANKNIETTGDVKAKELHSINSTGDEGGQINLAQAATNSTLGGDTVTIDIWQNRFRIFEQGGDARGVYIDLSAATAGVGTNLLSGGGGIALTDLSVGTEGTASGDGAISYNNTTGVFTYTPPTAAGIGALTDIVNDTTPQLGGNLDVNGNSIVSTSNGNIVIEPNGTGDVYLNADTVRVGDANANATITTNGTGSLTLNTNSGTNSGSIFIGQGANQNIVLTPNGTGDVYLISDTVYVGDANSPTFITTSGTGSLSISTNDNTNSGSIIINQGTNGNIEITPNGTGQTVVKNLEYNEAVFSLGTTSGTIAPNATNGNIQTITLNGNLTINGFTSPVSGQTITLIITTGGTGRTLTSSMLFAGGSKTLSTNNTTDILTMSYIGTTYYASLVKGYA